MSKKRNLAVLMAAATVATSVAPVFADTTASLDGQEVSAKDSAKLDQLKSEIQGLLDKKYTTEKDLLKDEDLAGKSVYEIKAGAASINSMRDLDKLIANLDGENDKISITATDLGFKEVDGKILDNEVKKFKQIDIDALKTGKYTDIKDEDGKVISDAVESVDYSKDTVILSLKNNDQKLTLKVGDLQTLSYAASGALETDPVTVSGVVKYKEDALGNKLDEDDKVTTDETEFVVVGFETVKKEIEDKENKSYTIVNKNIVESVNASDLYNLDLKKLTQKGNSVVNFINDYNAAEDESDNVTGEYNANDNTLKLTVKVNKDDVENKFTNLSIKGTKDELAALSTIFTAADVTITNAPAAVADAEDIATIAGADREDTSIRVSKKAYQGTTKADNVVLVSGYKVADGLAATPFASAKKAPVLLTGSSETISKPVMDEIQRVMKNGGTVYLVGGESSLSKNMENQLDAKFIKVKRIAGADRMETSLKVAQELVDGNHSSVKKDDTTKLFVAGGYAEADAMSVAAVAAKGNGVKDITPILLTDNNGLTQSQLTWLNREDASIDETYVAGGVNSVPTNVSSQLNPFTAKTTRLAGEDRQGTNAKVIAEFYKTAPTDLYVAKSDNNGLVDALPSGVLAAKDAAPVVLATDELSSMQKSALEKVGFDADASATKKTQIGNGIADAVWKAINKIK